MVRTVRFVVRHHEYVLPSQDDGGMRRRSGQSRRGLRPELGQSRRGLRPEPGSISCPLAEYATASLLVSHF